jgi:hypothetical protein
MSCPEWPHCGAERETTGMRNGGMSAREPCFPAVLTKPLLEAFCDSHVLSTLARAVTHGVYPYPRLYVGTGWVTGVSHGINILGLGLGRWKIQRIYVIDRALSRTTGQQ